ncbi:DUF1643 domain-containing protein [Pseudobythopirellula maris]|uniref:DUF1643 domain-containing protein n=1 Tax=Pseudobythopirellula maris TaxID=2527991 RepID=UPI0011B7BE11
MPASSRRPAREEILRRASFSHCGVYRYSLRRYWGNGEVLLVVGLNPSTADATKDDPTVRRCVGFAKSWGFGTLIIANLFAYRATDPTVLAQVSDPVGPSNDRTLKRLAAQADFVLAAWGTRGKLSDREQRVLTYLQEPYCLGTTSDGHPRHPLYVRADQQPQPYTAV